MYCSKCGKEIVDEAIVCPYCGVATKNINNSNNNPNITITNKNVNKVGRKRHSILLDLIMICCTGGLWIVWMILRR